MSQDEERREKKLRNVISHVKMSPARAIIGCCVDELFAPNPMGYFASGHRLDNRGTSYELQSPPYINDLKSPSYFDIGQPWPIYLARSWRTVRQSASTGH